MNIDPKLADAILKQLEDVYPDSIQDTTQILPEKKDDEKRELIRKTLLILKDQRKITLREGQRGTGIVALLFDIRLKK